MAVYSNNKAKSRNHITKVSNESFYKEIVRFLQTESYGTISKFDPNLLSPTEQQDLQILTNIREKHNIKKWSLINTFTMEK